jgi:catechol O-methyltransferase
MMRAKEPRCAVVALALILGLISRSVTIATLTLPGSEASDNPSESESKLGIFETSASSQDLARSARTFSDLLDDEVSRRTESAELVHNLVALRDPENGPRKYHRGIEEDLLQTVISRATSGDPWSVISAVDDYCYGEHWMMNVGPEKGRVVDAAISLAQPSVVVELGTYVGYSAVRFAAQLQAGAHLWSIDPDPRTQENASKLLEKAGLRESVTLLRGRAEDVIPQLSRETGGRPIDLLFIDHAKKQYLPDLRRIEDAGLLRDGSVVAADNVLAFAVDEYLDHVRNSGRYHVSRTYTTTLEYDDTSTPGVDGVEVSVYAGK